MISESSWRQNRQRLSQWWWC